MISGIQVALKNAIDVIAPPATPLQDFTYHWKQLMNFYVNHLNDCKAPIQTTSIPRHIDRLLEILLLEEKTESDPGPCLEYLLQHKLLDLLATLASAETPPGMRIICLSFLRKLLARSKYPLLDHAAIYGPVQRLVTLCNGTSPSPIETEEIQFLLTLCFLVCKYPHMTNMINNGIVACQPCDPRRASFDNRLDVEKVTYMPARRRNNSNALFEPLNTQAITLINPNLFNQESDGGPPGSKDESLYVKSDLSTTSKDTDCVSRSPSPAIQNPTCDSPSVMVVPICSAQSEATFDAETSEQIDSSVSEIEAQLETLRNLRLNKDNDIYENIDSTNNDNERSLSMSLSQTRENSECLLLDILMSYVNSADNTVRIRACEGIMVLASLEDSSFARIVAQSELPSIVTDRLEKLFKAIPAHVDPNEIDTVEVTWGLDSPLWTKDKKFPGCRQVAAFFVWFDYSNQLIKEAHTDVAKVLAKNIRSHFFDKIITPALADHHVVLITALLTKCLKDLTASVLSNEISHWLVGQNRQPEIPNVWMSPVLHRLIDNCYTESDELTVETLKLFEEMIDKRNEHTLHCLVLVYLITRGYYDSTAADSAITTWSDEEDEREREREKKGVLGLSCERTYSRTLAPSNIHRIMNCFLSLVPRFLQTDSDINRYEKYMVDWEKQYSTVLRDCSLMSWPLEAVTHDDSASSDSRPEADHGATRFYMGPFLTMLLDKVGNMPKQKYDINLQLMVVISRLALLPHPYLHEYLLNPLLPLVPGTKSLFMYLQRVVKQLANEVPKTPNYKEILKKTREDLLEDSTHNSGKDDVLFRSVIIIEEFCKELAAITYVKYHRSIG